MNVPAKKKVDQVIALEPAEISGSQFEQLEHIARVDLGGSDDALAALGAEELNRAEFSVLRAGAYFLKLKAQTDVSGKRTDLATAMSPGSEAGFSGALAAVGVQPRQAQRAMQIASYVAALPQDQARRIASLRPSKILPLVNADPEVVEDLLQQGSLDGEQPLSIRDLKKELAKLQALNKKLSSDAEEARLEVQAIQHEAAGFDLAHWAVSARSEAVCQGQALSTALDILGEAIDKHVINAPPGKQDRAERARHQQAAAGALYHTIVAAGTRAAALARRLTANFGEDIALGVAPDHMLSPDEAERCEAERCRIFQSARKDFALREIERANTKPGRRGRKLDPKKLG